MIAFIFFSSLSALAFLVGLLTEPETSRICVLLLCIALLGGSGVWIWMYGKQREVAREQIKTSAGASEIGLGKVGLIIGYYAILGVIVVVIVFRV